MSQNKRLQLGVLISGTGSNLKAIIDAIDTGSLQAEIKLLVASRPEARGIGFAKAACIPTLIMQKAEYQNPEAADIKIAKALLEAGAELVVMAGYMRKVTAPLLSAFPNRILNLHPALLPSFEGAHAIEDAYKRGVKLTGVTIHLANAEYDRGPILAQEPLRICPEWTLDELEEEIHTLEHRLYPEVLQQIASGALPLP